MKNDKRELKNKQRCIPSFSSLLSHLSSRNGFTLIELVIIIGILGVMAAAVIGVLNPAEQFKKANDARRKTDLEQLQRALEMYYEDKGRYPDASADFKISVNSQTITWGSSWQPYSAKLPTDPTGGNTYVYYTSPTSDGQTYYLYAHLERGDRDSQACNEGNACASLDAPGFPTANACGKVCSYGVSSSNVRP